ncbi:MAG TPA: non-canonical purine NTP pyrophosphatase [Acidobacteriaceae bacterium]|nr:non-canonical purine NTP pyrophosphatase [Acidobacteriaceae bacterium]
MSITLRFVSKNEDKLKEAMAILDPVGITVKPLHIAINELQVDDVEKLVRDKVLKAFAQVRRALFVEHTGLYLDAMEGKLPGGLTQVFWDNLRADKFAELFGRRATGVRAETVIGYCDTKQIHLFRASVRGNVPETPRGPRHFQWDCVFVPEGETETFAEMGDRKNSISMRRKALEQLAEHLGKSFHHPSP